MIYAEIWLLILLMRLRPQVVASLPKYTIQKTAGVTSSIVHRAHRAIIRR